MFDKKILVVDDDTELLELIKKALIGEGYDVISAETAKDAMDIARRELPDLILIDIVLPDMEGPEAILILSNDEKTHGIPAIFLSGIVTRDNTGVASTDILVGKRAYKALSKPFSSQELMTEVRKAIG